ncbi:MAG: hypothetical protein HY235_30490, partial [Acidobacteria bacterium]|nr:hypothetical protein [Acidobacteriota bacterium]
MNRLDPIGRREFLALLAAAGSFAADKISTPLLTRAEKEQFLRDAKIIKTKGVSQGITGTVRATMSDGKLTHDASIQVIDEYKQQFQTAMGTELNFKDSWKFNLAAYKLDRLLGLNMVPVTVERRFRNQLGSSTWWVDDVLMTELTRYNKKV